MNLVRFIKVRYWRLRTYILTLLNPRPFMSDDENAFIEALINKGPRYKYRLFEYGAGASTVYWGKKLLSQGNVYSVEHKRKWLGLVKLSAYIHSCNNVALLFRSDKDNYIKSVQSSAPYHLVIIDSLYRNECMVAAKDLVVDGGYIVLHDAQRDDYNWSLAGSEVYKIIESPQGEKMVVFRVCD